MKAGRIKNWHEFQHFKDRRPPWIKLHRDILEKRDISAISDCSFRVLVGCWLLASEDKDMIGTLPPVDDIAFRLRLPKDKVIKSLDELKNFLIQDDINAISTRYQSDVPETETETERETKKETDTARPFELPFKSPAFIESWNGYVDHRKKMKAPMTDRAKTLALNKLPKSESEAIRWIDNATEKGWRGIYEPGCNGIGGGKRQLTATQKMNMTQAEQDKWLSENS